MIRSTNFTKESGVVLVVALVFLVALTAVGAALMQNSTTDMKMSGASEDKTVALQELVSAVDEVIFNQVNGGDNRFARPANDINYPIENDDLLPNTNTSATAEVEIINNDYNLDVDCPRMKPASSSGTFACNMLRVNVNRAYGRKGNSTATADSGIAQQLLK